MKTPTVKEKTWKEFRESGLLWWINMILHTFGWALVIGELDSDGNVKEVFPARVKYRGFEEEINTSGYQKVTSFLKENIEDLEKEANEEE